jgi:phage terminase large subunit
MPWQVISKFGEESEREVYQDLQKNPLKFFRKILRIKFITHDQEAIVKSVLKNKFTGVKAAHGIGKTFIEACIAVWFLFTHKDSMVITTAPTERQVRDLLWSQINHLLNKSLVYIGGKEKQTGYSLAPRWFAAGITTTAGNEEDSAVRFQGYHAKHILVIIDEAVGVHQAIWEAIDGITNSENAKILAVGNPMTPNCAFKKHIDTGQWNVITVSALNHPNVVQKKEIIPGAVSYKWIKDKIKMWCNTPPSLPEGEEMINCSFFQFEKNGIKQIIYFSGKFLVSSPRKALIP